MSGKMSWPRFIEMFAKQGSSLPAEVAAGALRLAMRCSKALYAPARILVSRRCGRLLRARTFAYKCMRKAFSSNAVRDTSNADDIGNKTITRKVR
jgi:hypothetical protein